MRGEVNSDGNCGRYMLLNDPVEPLTPGGFNEHLTHFEFFKRRFALQFSIPVVRKERPSLCWSNVPSQDEELPISLAVINESLKHQ